MGLTEIVILVIGLLCVAVSFFLTEKLGYDKKTEEKMYEDIRAGFKAKLLEKENLDVLYSLTEGALSERATELIDTKLEGAQDTMETISNNKIMEFDDYSSQILGKIDQNHTEVVFLYDMLKEKEGQLKDYAAKVDGVGKKLQVMIDAVEKEEKRIEEEKKALSIEKAKIEERSFDTALHADPVRSAKKTVAQTAPEKKEKAANAEKSVKPAKTVKTAKSDNTVIKTGEPGIVMQSYGGNKNDRILELYKTGKSVVEISKMLGLGQGEVKLVIDLSKLEYDPD